MIRPMALVRLAGPGGRRAAWRWRAAREPGWRRPLLFAGGLYLLVAVLLVFRAAFIVPDAWSRVGNAAWVLIGRDPHLAALGFVWNPLPSILAMPLVLLGGVWSPLVASGFAANLVSAACMAAAAAVVWQIASDLAVRPLVKSLAVATFAAHPMIVLYGANGMSEAPFLLLLLVAVRHLLLWTRSSATAALVVTGIALALAYLTRYEAIAAAAGAFLVVASVTYRRSSGPPRARLPAVAAELLVVGTPVAFAFVGWALASWIITGNPFETFASAYGNAAQVALAGASITAVTGHGLAAVAYGLSQALSLAPAMPVLLAVSVFALVRRRQGASFVPLALFGGVLAFALLTIVTGTSFGWLRFMIAAIPLSVVLGLIAIAPSPRPALGLANPGSPPHVADPREHLGPRSSAARFDRERLAALAIVALLAVALPVGLSAMNDPRLGREEAPQIRALGSGPDAPAAGRQQAEVGRAMAAHLDRLELPAGSVVVDVAIGFPIVLQSTNPRQFVITPDRDFEPILTDPSAFGARYLLVPAGSGYTSLDAVGRQYPSLFATGAGIAHLEAEFRSDVIAWRLYRIDCPVAAAGSSTARC